MFLAQSPSIPPLVALFYSFRDPLTVWAQLCAVFVFHFFHGFITRYHFVERCKSAGGGGRGYEVVVR